MQKSLVNFFPSPFPWNPISNSKPLIFLSGINRSKSKIQKLVGMIFLSLCFAAKATSSLKERTVWIIVTGFVAISLTATAVYTAQKIMKKYLAKTQKSPEEAKKPEESFPINENILLKTTNLSENISTNKSDPNPIVEYTANTEEQGVELSSVKTPDGLQKPEHLQEKEAVIKTETGENLSSGTLPEEEEENKNTSSIPKKLDKDTEASINTEVSQEEEIEYFTMMPNETNIKDGWLYSDRFINTFKNSLSTPERLRTVISNYLNVYKADLNKSYTSLPAIAAPTIHALEKIAVHYKQKYEIKIKVCNYKNLGQLLKTLKEEKEITGVIIEGKDLPTNHVIPILCDFSQERTDVIILDILGENGSNTLRLCQKIKKECATQNLNCKSSIAARQVDQESCRTESLVVLRNALIDIQQNQKAKKGIGHDRLIGPENRFIMPLEWDYHNQIKNQALSEESTAKILRYKLSKQASKRNKIQTVLEFRASHAEKVKTRCELKLKGEFLRSGRGDTFKNGQTVVKELLELDLGTPPAFKIESNLLTLPTPIDESKVEVSIIWEEERVFNTYQVTKGHKYRKKLTNPSLKREEDQ